MAFSSKPSHLSILLLLFSVVLLPLAQRTLAGRPPPVTNPNKSDLQAAQSTPTTGQTEGANSGKKQQAETNPGGEKEQARVADADKKQTECFGVQEGTAPLTPVYGVPADGGDGDGNGGGGGVTSDMGGGVPAGTGGQYVPGNDDTFVPNPGFEVPNPAYGAP